MAPNFSPPPPGADQTLSQWIDAAVRHETATIAVLETLADRLIDQRHTHTLRLAALAKYRRATPPAAAMDAIINACEGTVGDDVTYGATNFSTIDISKFETTSFPPVLLGPGGDYRTPVTPAAPSATPGISLAARLWLIVPLIACFIAGSVAAVYFHAHR